MHLIYIDESGNTGSNLNDAQQPVFVLGALLIPAEKWQHVEQDLENALQTTFPELAKNEVEVHAAELRNGSHVFRGVPVEQRLQLRDAWFAVAKKHSLRFIQRTIIKRQFQKWVHDTFGTGVAINPQIVAFPLVSMVVNDALSQADSLGILISDDNKEIVNDVEKFIRNLRLATGPLRLSHIIEKVFFIDSAKSRPLQLCDLLTLHIRKHVEVTTIGMEGKSIDAGAYEAIETLITKGNERFFDVHEWFKAMQLTK